ncbi:MAG TPA: plastocyanin/azurin family copper-binding protein [Anaeromyxobacteraceae bacterium]|nr:plastocyanin/azurin family copper-binding protein [Anaeromyxobacteraceae bacterium]
MTARHAPRLAAASLALALAAAALADGGTVTGTVEATPPKYLEETVVYLKNGPPAAKPRTLSMDQKSMTFVPHVLVVAVGDTVKFLNHDNVVHNVYSPDGDGYNLGSFKQDEVRTATFAKPGAYTQLCSIHPEMLGFIYAAPGPFAAAVDKKGHFSITGVPPGTYTLAVWNSHLKGPEKSVTVGAGQTVTEKIAVKR